MTHATIAQKTPLPVADWINKLEAEEDNNSDNFRKINHQLFISDSVTAHIAYHELEKKLGSANLYYKARYHCIQAEAQRKYNYSRGKAETRKLFEMALKEAYATGNTDLISYVSWLYGSIIYEYQEVELAATYCLKAVEINDKFLQDSSGYIAASVLGEVLFHCREYEKSIYYTRWSIANWSNTSPIRDSNITKLWNTVGQAYQRQGMLDSAMANYDRSMTYAKQTNFEIWKAINSGDEAQIFFLKKEYEKAMPLLAYDYSINKNADLNIAACALQWMARINLIEGKKDSALLQAKEALRLLAISDPNNQQKQIYLQQAYYTTADIYRSTGKTDSFHHYFQNYITLHDSLERVVARSSFDISSMRNDNEKKFYTIQTMQHEKQVQVQQRNFIIAAIVVLAAFTLLLINRQRLKLKYQQELAAQEKLRIEQEMESAKAQLKMFTQNIVEKTNLIEQLERQVHDKTISAQDQQIISQLGNQTILTEEDWEKFKALFEKIYPLFFQRLKNIAADITIAEQRMAALTRLLLTSRQMASMLGISVDSVHKTRQRLRKRFDLSNDANLTEYIAAI